MHDRSVAFQAVVMLVLAACAAEPVAPDGSPARPAIANDVHSLSRPREVRVTFLDLDLQLDFESQQVRGHVDLYLERNDPNAPLVLDTSGLTIEEVTGPGGSQRQFAVGDSDPILGAPLTVQLLPGDGQVRVRYETDPGARALQWLQPEQTSGGTLPFLYTQGQAILTRSWIPLQDSPGVRVTYQARIRAPDGLVAVMSAESSTRAADGSFSFSMSKPIPPYLIALACGDLQKRDISGRCAVWGEPGVVPGARRELADTEAMLLACEELFGPYRWGRYDVLILPPAFPFGGMENPCLTFATPTILAGDKSLVGLIAHELAHSWSGNLVTNATWGDFWLNEGFAVYMEQRIMEQVYGRERAEMEILLGMQQLERELQTLPSAAQVLQIDLTGQNPDDGMTAVPYDKGAAFLRRLEEVYGRTALDRFLADYFEAHAFQSMTTGGFLAYLDEHLQRERPAQRASVDLDEWIRDSGLPEDAPRPASAAFVQVDSQIQAWVAGGAAADLDTEDWVTQQWLHFLNGLPESGSTRMAELDQAFGLTEIGNAEILTAWLQLTIREGYEPAMPYLREFLARVGRRKFLTALYGELAKTEAGKAAAREIYAECRPRYHAVSTRTLDQMLEWQR